MLDDMDGTYFAERAIAKREREMIEICDDIGARVQVAIQPDRSWIFIYPAAYVEY